MFNEIQHTTNIKAIERQVNISSLEVRTEDDELSLGYLINWSTGTSYFVDYDSQATIKTFAF